MRAPAACRSVECRPSAAMTRVARISCRPPDGERGDHPTSLAFTRAVEASVSIAEELGKGLAWVRHEGEEVPLRHERDEPAAASAAGRSRRPAPRSRSSGSRHTGDLAVRQAQELVGSPSSASASHRGRVDGVAAEVAQEIPVLLQHRHVDAGPRQQVARHHAGRPTAGDDASGGTLGSVCHGRRTLEEVAMGSDPAGLTPVRYLFDPPDDKRDRFGRACHGVRPAGSDPEPCRAAEPMI